MVPTVEHLSVELLRDGVHARDLVDPCAVAHNQSIGICFVFFVYEETNSLYEGPFNL